LQELSLVKHSRQQLQQLFSPPQQQQQQQQDTQLLPCLTKLSILADGVGYSPLTTPGLYQLTSLRHLDLRGAEVASVTQLAALSQLESLVLHSVTSLKLVGYNSDSDSDNESDGHDDGGDSDGYDDDDFPDRALRPSRSVADRGSLLQLLPQLPRLTCLDLFGLAQPEQAAVPQWTCLGRCTGLQVLRLQHLLLHRNSWPLLFTGAQLGSLRQLRLTSFLTAPGRRAHHVPMPPQCIQQMVDACPNLEVLQLGGDGLLSGRNSTMNEGPPNPPVSLSPLAQLQHLTRLRVYSLRTQVCCCAQLILLLCALAARAPAHHSKSWQPQAVV
jgi:hypothetical protein